MIMLLVICFNKRIESKYQVKINYHKFLLFRITTIKTIVFVYYVYIRIYRIKEA